MITEKEDLFQTVSFDRFVEIVKDPNSVITRYDRDRNCFGEFRFVTVSNKDRCLTFFFNGLHEYRNQYLLNDCYFYESNFFLSKNKSHQHNKKIVLDTIHQERKKMFQIALNEAREPDEDFCMIADETDDDHALSLVNEGLI